MVSKSKVKEFLRIACAGEPPRISGDFMAKLDEKVKVLVKAAVARAKGNSRKTLQDYDL